MNTDFNDNDFDRRTRQLHATALASISPQTLAKLRAARNAATSPARPRHAWRWAAATAFSAVFAVAIGVQFVPRTATPVAPAQPVASAAATSDYSTSLDENPDLYVWLASADGQRLASE